MVQIAVTSDNPTIVKQYLHAISELSNTYLMLITMLDDGVTMVTINPHDGVLSSKCNGPKQWPKVTEAVAKGYRSFASSHAWDTLVQYVV